MKSIATKIIMVICSVLVVAGHAESRDVLLRVPFQNDAELRALTWERMTVLYEDVDFVIARADDAERLYELNLPSYMLLDYMEPDDRYYLMRAGDTEQLAAIEKHGRVLLRFRSSVIVRVSVEDEVSLLRLGLPAMPLLKNVVAPPTLREPIMPQMLRSASERVADSRIVQQLIDEVDSEGLRGIIYDLQENVDLDPPHTAFRSRFAFRVQNTDNPSDDACDNAAEYIFNKFQSYGLEVEYDLFDYEEKQQVGYAGEDIRGNYEMRNVIGTLPGKGPNSDQIYIVCAHYDSIAANESSWSLFNRWKTMDAPGADDNASGVAAVIETARILSKADLECTLKFIAFSGEEIWMLGSKHYAEAASERGENIIGVINMDMIGHESGALDAAVMANQSSAWLANVVTSARDDHNIDLEVRSYIDPSVVASDHSSFWSKRYSAVVLAETYYGDLNTPEFSPVYHTTRDTVDRLNMDLVARTTQLVIATLGEVADPANPDLSVQEDEIRFSEDFPMPGRPMTITVPVHNLGDGDAADADVQIWLEGPRQKRDKIHEQTIDVEAGGTEEISASIDPQWGKYDLIVELNPDFTISESDGGNNMVEMDFDALPPDLSVTSKEFRFSDDRFSMGYPVTFTVPIHNLGPGDILNADVQVRLLGPSAAEDAEPHVISEQEIAIKANQTEEISTALTLTELDWYELSVEVNSGYKNLEPEDSNNWTRQLIKISPPNLSIQINDMLISDPSPDKGQQITLTARVTNEGSGNAIGTVIQVWVLGPSTDHVPQMVYEQTVDVKYKESHEISVPLSFTQWGEHEVTVKVNPDSSMYETDFDDNAAAKLIEVSASTFELAGFILYPNPITFTDASQLQIRYELSRDAETTIEIYAVSGKLVYQEEFADGEIGGRAGPNDIFWQGVNQHGGHVASGIYICRIVATDDQDATQEKIKKIAVLR